MNTVPSILQKIVAHKREEVAVRKAMRPIIDLYDAPPVRDFTAALRGEHVGLIAEVKQASPSKGIFRADFDPVGLARSYAAHGAACLSVLTDEAFFKGHDRYLQQIRAAVEVPLLRKDFVIDAWQIDESRLLGADAILLIVAILEDDQLAAYHARATELGMAVLVETHTEHELHRALAIRPPLLGINNRDLHTFETTLETTERLSTLAASQDHLLVSESGINTPEDVARVARCGARAVLVGEALMREGHPEERTRALASVPVPA